jgi:hypothetical protein
MAMPIGEVGPGFSGALARHAFIEWTGGLIEQVERPGAAALARDVECRDMAPGRPGRYAGTSRFSVRHRVREGSPLPRADRRRQKLPLREKPDDGYAAWRQSTA